jgi:hypothetical protein
MIESFTEEILILVTTTTEKGDINYFCAICPTETLLRFVKKPFDEYSFNRKGTEQNVF